MNETEEQKQKRYKEWADDRLAEIDYGGCNHNVWVLHDLSIGGQLMHKINPVVQMANDDDGWYCQTFKTRAEVDAFIAELQKCADEAWGAK